MAKVAKQAFRTPATKSEPRGRSFGAGEVVPKKYQKGRGELLVDADVWDGPVVEATDGPGERRGVDRDGIISKVKQAVRG